MQVPIQAAPLNSDTIDYNMKLANAFSSLGLAIDSQISDEVVLSYFEARLAEIPMETQDLLEHLAIVSDYRGSASLREFCRDTAYKHALNNLGAAEEDQDGLINALLTVLSKPPTTASDQEAVKAAKVIADYRTSSMLKKSATDAFTNTKVRDVSRSAGDFGDSARLDKDTDKNSLSANVPLADVASTTAESIVINGVRYIREPASECNDLAKTFSVGLSTRPKILANGIGEVVVQEADALDSAKGEQAWID